MPASLSTTVAWDSATWFTGHGSGRWAAWAVPGYDSDQDLWPLTVKAMHASIQV
jgi:hypothetical protein